MKNQQLGNSGKGKHTWLSGLLKCAECGYSLKVSVTPSGRYLHCSGRYNLFKCKAEMKVDIAEIEEAVAARIQAFLDESPDPPMEANVQDGCARKLDELERKADRIMDAFTESCEMTSAYLNRALKKIEDERRSLLANLRRENGRVALSERLVFNRLSFDEKKTVAAQLIQKIRISGEDVEICWNV